MAIAGAIASRRVALATFHWRFASRQGISLVVNRSHVPSWPQAVRATRNARLLRLSRWARWGSRHHERWSDLARREPSIFPSQSKVVARSEVDIS